MTDIHSVYVQSTRRSSIFKLGLKATLFFDEGLAIHGLALEEDIRAHLVDRPRGTGDHLLMSLHQPAVLGNKRCLPACLRRHRLPRQRRFA